MAKKTLTEAFDVKPKETPKNGLKDYDIFGDKGLLDSLRTKIVQNLIEENIPDDGLLEDYINNEIDNTLSGYDLGTLERGHIFNLIQNEIMGYGPITPLLQDNAITEIMVNAPNEIYVEIDGKIAKDETVSFINDKHIIRTIQRIVQPLGRTIDAANPMVDARLRDGSRLNAVIPPLSLKGPVLTIRKFNKKLESIDDLLRGGSLTVNMARFLEAAVQAKLNIIISGGTGTGKTTLLNHVLANQEGYKVISLETRLINYEGEGEVTIRDLVRNSLRMRPDRIIVGEVRGKEAFDMMQAMNTGHEGSLTTLHANNSIDTINRLETMILMNEMEIPVSAVRGYIANAIDLIVQIDRLSDGKRKITSISEIDGMKDGEIVLKEIFSFKQVGVANDGSVMGEFGVYKRKPRVYDKITRKGIDLKDIFN